MKRAKKGGLGFIAVLLARKLSEPNTYIGNIVDQILLLLDIVILCRL